MYLCIDLKSFYASCECSMRGLDPFKVNLVVADKSRGNGTITLAVTPHMKKLGVKSRCRLFEIDKNIDYIIAKPRMRKYMEISSYIYGIYLNYFAEEDMHVYSIDEVFIDLGPYLNMYNKTPMEIAHMIMDDVYEKTNICSTVGIGTNLYLAKIAMDIFSKHSNNNIGYLDEELFKKYLWKHRPLTDFWGIGRGITERLNNLGIFDMEDISKCDEGILYKEFGINARLLIDHSLGIESTTMKDIKKYVPKSKSLSSSQILFRDYNYNQARVVLKEMIDDLMGEVTKRDVYVIGIYLSIGYSKDVIKAKSYSKKIDGTVSYKELLKNYMEIYSKYINKIIPIRRISISFMISDSINRQLDMFNEIDIDKDKNLNREVESMKNRYGNNTILRAISLEECANQMDRNRLVGGHNAN